MELVAPEMESWVPSMLLSIYLFQHRFRSVWFYPVEDTEEANTVVIVTLVPQ